MYFKLSTQIYINVENIVGIFDLENTTTAKSTRKFLYSFDKSDVITVGNDIPRSYILYRKNKNTNNMELYLLPDSTRSVIKRIKAVKSEKEMLL